MATPNSKAKGLVKVTGEKKKGKQFKNKGVSSARCLSPEEGEG